MPQLSPMSWTMMIMMCVLLMKMVSTSKKVPINPTPSQMKTKMMKWSW